MFGSMEVLVFPAIYDNCSQLIREGAAVKIRGRISFTEEKDPKLICDSITMPPSQESMKNTGGGVYEQQSRKKQSNPGLYIRVADMNCREYKKALQYIEVFDGTSDLYIYDISTKKLIRAPAKYRVDVNDALINALKKLLGDKNVAVKAD
jgi:DNA polymerase-3 subunit alpha